MADSKAITLPEAVRRFKNNDPTLKSISIYNKDCLETELSELIDCLLAYPNRITSLGLSYIKLTDETGIKIARYIASSNSISWIDLQGNEFGEKTYTAIAAALKFNTSLRIMYLFGNRRVNESHIESLFIDALILNPNRPFCSHWPLFTESSDYYRLKEEAKRYSHPNLQSLLATQLIRTELIS